MDSSAHSEPAYHSPDYWNEQYGAKESRGDWYCNYASLRDFLLPRLGSKNKDILITGCGDSDLGRGLASDGFRYIVSVDIAPAVVDKMNKLKLPNERYECMDVTKLQYDLSSYDIVLDKACLDALCTSAETVALAREALREEYRVLRPGGWLYLISFAGPDIYDPLLGTVEWHSKECEKLQLDWGVYYVFTLQKPQTTGVLQ